MKKLRIGFVDTFGAIEDFFTEVLSREYEIERDDERPDYLIFGDRNFGTKNNQPQYRRYDLRRIFFTGENERPSSYNAHYSISFDHTEGRNYRLPLYVIYDWDNKRKGVPHAETAKRDYCTPNRKFCSFVVKNGGCDQRNNFFHKLNTYKQVDSAGPLFNNMGFVLERGARAVEAKAEFLPKYKFNMCFENSSYPGYATEKLYEALVFDTVPIYWGSPTIEVDFNPRAFLNWHDYQDDDAFLQRIIEVDSNEAEYMNMYHEHMFTEYTKTKFFDMDRFLHWWKKEVE